ncbi:MAG: CRISPR-associated helicase Cas3' [Myxococcota bacterium]
MPQHLPAKSPRRDGELLSLDRHCAETEEAASRLFRPQGEWSRWGNAWCRFFRIPVPLRDRWLLNLRVACLAHDLGKANADFVKAVIERGFHEQPIRHEHLSALFLHLPAVRAWLRGNTGLDVDVITAAVLSHHLKAHDGTGEHPPWQWGNFQGLVQQVVLHFSHPDVQRILDRMAEVAGLPRLTFQPPARYTAKEWEKERSDGKRAAHDLRKAACGTSESVEARDPARQSLLLATKAGVIVADAVSSGLFREGHSLADWIARHVHRPPLAAEDLEREILAPRIRELEGQRKAKFSYHRFQDLAAEQPGRALLMAACGAGKSMAAYRWAQSQLAHQPLGSVLFLYPTRGTATEGFRDYVGHAPETEATLLHGSSAYELRGIAENPSEATQGKNYSLEEASARLFALGLWGRRYFSATVDQFISFMEHRYESLCLLPLLADSAVIIDEVHSFSESMLRSLLAFLKRFDVPVLCMTATLLPQRREQLQAAGLKVFPDGAERAELQDLEVAEDHPRYSLEPVEGEEEALQRAVAAFEAGNRVLWVVNTVRRCQALARKLDARLGRIPLCYHSRFKLDDRKRMHGETVSAFKQRATPQVAVTTQVCEMSLDLDADVLITEWAPPSSLVQRFGRCNRKLDGKKDGFTGRLITYKPESHRPYEKEDLADAAAFLAELPGSTLSQKKLAEKLDALPRRGGTPSTATAFLTGGYFATPGHFREEDEFGANAVLRTEAAEVVAALERGKPIDGYLINVPRKDCLPDAERPAGLPPHVHVVDENRYTRELGFLVDKETA